MDMTLVPPQALMPGDSVIIDNQPLRVKAVEGPDHLDTFDIYLTGDNGDCHKIVHDAVLLINE